MKKKTAPLTDQTRTQKRNTIPKFLTRIFNLPHNRESDCLDRCVVTKVDLGHYVHKKTYVRFFSNPSPPLILRTKLTLCSGSKKEKEPQESIRDCNKHCGHKCREGITRTPYTGSHQYRTPSRRLQYVYTKSMPARCFRRLYLHR